MDIFEQKDNGTALIQVGKLTKESLRGGIASSVVQSVADGDADALEVYIKAKGLVEIANAIMDGVKEEAITDAERFGAQGGVKLGVTFQAKSSPTTYSYEDNPDWAKLEEQIASLKAAQKELEKQMVIAMKFSAAIDDNGFVIIPAIVKSYGATTVSITIPKA